MKAKSPPTLEWKKCPSVSGGGKPHFWFLRIKRRYPEIDRLFHVVWNRFLESWVVMEQNLIRVSVSSEQEGKQWVEKLLKKEESE